MRNLLLIVLIINLFSCIPDVKENYNENQLVKFNVIKEILKETWLIEAHKINNQNYSLFSPDSINEISLSILRKHNTNPRDFKNTLVYFSNKPLLLDSLLSSIKEDLEETYLSLPHEDENDIQELSNTEIITILKQCPFYIYKHNEKKISMNTELRDSLFIYFRRNPEKLGHSTLRSLSNKLNLLIKENTTR